MRTRLWSPSGGAAIFHGLDDLFLPHLKVFYPTFEMAYFSLEGNKHLFASVDYPLGLIFIQLYREFQTLYLLDFLFRVLISQS